MPKFRCDFDELDCQLLNIIQTDFPFCSHPYDEIGKRLGITKEEVLSRVTAMRESGTIRRIGANFDAAGLGWQLALKFTDQGSGHGPHLFCLRYGFRERVLPEPMRKVFCYSALV